MTDPRPTALPRARETDRARRARRRRRAVVLALAFLLVLGGGVFAVVGILGVLDARGPIIERCDAYLTDTVRPSLTPEQSDNAALIAAVAVHRGLPARAATIGIATAMQESKLENINYGDRDSVGLFQQRPSQGWGTVEQIMDPVYAVNAFYDVLVTIEGYEDLQVTDAAQSVQRSAFPDAYADHEQMARSFSSALGGYSPASLTCRLNPATDEEAAGATAAVTARLTRDFVEIDASITDDGAVLVDAASLAPGAGEEEATRLGWAVAQWAVMTAHVTGASSVTTDGMTWDRSHGADADWAPADDGTEPLAVGQVLIR